MLQEKTLIEIIDKEKMNSAEETKRQLAFMEKAGDYVEKLAKELGRRPTCCVTTFGCQMNARDSEKLMGILKEAGFRKAFLPVWAAGHP